MSTITHTRRAVTNKQWDDSRRREQFTQLQKAAKKVAAADKRLSEFCSASKDKYSPIVLSQVGIVRMKNKKKVYESDKPEDREAIDVALYFGSHMIEMNNEIDRLVANGISLQDCLEESRKILAPLAQPLIQK